MIPFRYAAGLCLVISALTACSDTREYIREKYTGERHGDAVVGQRRPPVLNPAYAASKRPTVPAVPIVPIVPNAGQQQAHPAKAPAAPYDQYDNQGNDATRTNYVKEWLGDKDAPATPAAPVQMSTGRKPFKGSVAALQPAMPVEIVPQSPPDSLIHPAPQTREAPPLLEEEDNGVFLPDPDQRVSAAESPSAQLAQLQPAAGGQVPATYPHLADVPKRPAEMQQLRRNKPAAENELRSEHEAAMEQKKRLAEEPTELVPVPVTLPKVEGMLRDIDQAIHGDKPIVQAAR